MTCKLIVSRLAKLLTCTALTLACFSAPTFSQTAPEKSTCLFYEHFNYQGEHFGLYKRDALVTNDSVSSALVYGDGPVGRRFVSTEWAGRVSSLKVPPNCMAIVTNGGKPVGLWKDLASFSADFNDKSIGFGCHCK